MRNRVWPCDVPIFAQSVVLRSAKNIGCIDLDSSMNLADECRRRADPDGDKHRDPRFSSPAALRRGTMADSAAIEEMVHGSVANRATSQAGGGTAEGRGGATVARIGRTHRAYRRPPNRRTRRNLGGA